ncbi:hypothetical protein TWF696_002770 [Orbilia brochopaga]|uniref:F-box domain-containing protein n=1 Tax=Orbilia brochopaga TaxID=3140254 RepID=A0AAV9U2N6_9PEZI
MSTDPGMSKQEVFDFLGLPLDVLKMIFDRLGTRALYRLAQCNHLLFELVIPHLYKDFRVTVRRRREDLDERLTSALDTLTSTDNNYASHIHDFAVAGEWFKTYANADAEYAKKGKLSPGVLMLNSLVKIAVMRMNNIESFAWDIRDVPLSKGLITMLQSRTTLKNLRFRLAERLHPNLRAAGMEPCFTGFKNIKILTIMLIETLEQLRQVGDIVSDSPDMVGIKVALKPNIPGTDGMDMSKILFRGPRRALSESLSSLRNINLPDESYSASDGFQEEPYESMSDQEGGYRYEDFHYPQKHAFVSLKLYRVMFPPQSNHLSRVIDFSKLVRLSLWQCGTHPAFWRSLTSSTEQLVPRLQCIITDDAIPELADFLESFSGLQEFYLVHSSGNMTMEQLTRGLLKHHECLKCLAVYHLEPDNLVFDKKAVRTLLRKCNGLRELALSVKDEDWSYFVNTLESLTSLLAIHVLLEDIPNNEQIAGTLGSLMAAAVGPLQDLEYVVVNDKYYRVEGSAGDEDPDEAGELDVVAEMDAVATAAGVGMLQHRGEAISPIGMSSTPTMMPEGLGAGPSSPLTEDPMGMEGYPPLSQMSQLAALSPKRAARPFKKRRAVRYVDLDPDQIDNINIFTVLRTTNRR